MPRQVMTATTRGHGFGEIENDHAPDSPTTTLDLATCLKQEPTNDPMLTKGIAHTRASATENSYVLRKNT